MLTDSQTARISDPNLQNYLERIAWNIHHKNYPMIDGEDILSQMNLAIIERASADPTFLDQKPGYITKAAAWAAPGPALPNRTASPSSDIAAFSTSCT